MQHWTLDHLTAIEFAASAVGVCVAVLILAAVWERKR
jgi:hypothetical protein